MVPALIVLTMAWTIQDGHLLSPEDGSSVWPPTSVMWSWAAAIFLSMIAFVLSALIAFSTGTEAGTLRS